MSLFIRTFCSVLILALLATGSKAAAETTIERLMPENAVIVVGVDNFEQMSERFRRTPMHELINAPEFREKREEFEKEFLEGWKEFLAEVDADEDMNAWPTGRVGLALHPVLDRELGTPMMALTAFAEFGDRMENVMDLVRKGIDKAETEGEFVHEEHDVLGRTVHVLDFGAMEEEFDEDDEFVDPFMMMLPDFSSLMDGFKRMYLTREGDALILASDLGSLTESLERIDRNAGGLADREEYQRVRDQIGTNDAIAMLLTRDLVQLLGGADQQGMMMMAGPMLKSILGDIRGMAMGIRLDGPTAMLEQKYSIYMPYGKAGLTKLFDVQQPREDLPAFVSPDTIMYGSFNFAFDQVVDVLRDIFQTNPMLGMMIGDGFQSVEGPLSEVMATLGPRMYYTQTLQRPITLESVNMLLAVDCRDEQGFENFIAQHAAQMGFEPRDFLGRRIYTMSDEMNMFSMMFGMGAPSISIGIGGGSVFVGETVGVEQALRIVCQQDRTPTLADNPAYRRAIAALPPRPFASWQYADLVTSMEGSEATARLSHEAMMERMRRDFPEMAAEMEAHGDGDDLEGIDIDWNVIRRYIGPSVSYIESTESGFVGVSYYLAADPDDR